MVGSMPAFFHHAASSPQRWISRLWPRHKGTVNSSLTLRPSRSAWALPSAAATAITLNWLPSSRAWSAADGLINPEKSPVATAWRSRTFISLCAAVEWTRDVRKTSRSMRSRRCKPLPSTRRKGSTQKLRFESVRRSISLTLRPAQLSPTQQLSTSATNQQRPWRASTSRTASTSLFSGTERCASVCFCRCASRPFSSFASSAPTMRSLMVTSPRAFSSEP